MTDTMPRCNDGSRRHSFSFTDATNTTLICTRCGRTKPVAAPRSYEDDRDAMLADAAATFGEAAEGETLTLRVPSQTVPGREYIIHVANGVATCNCQGYSSHRHCKHATAALKVLAEKQETHA